MNFELNQTVGLVERDQSKFLGVLVQQHMSIMLQTICNINQRNKVKYQNKAPKRVQDQATVNYISFVLESGASGAFQTNSMGQEMKIVKIIKYFLIFNNQLAQ